MRTEKAEAPVSQMYTQGFCVLEAVYTADETQAMRELLDDHWRAAGGSRTSRRPGRSGTGRRPEPS